MQTEYSKTRQEFYFLDHLGTGLFSTPGKKVNKEYRIRCLKGYIEAAKQPMNWGKINKNKCIAYAQHLLHQELNNVVKINYKTPRKQTEQTMEMYH